MKKTLLLLFSLVLTIITQAQIPTTGLVGYYPFTGNANDYSGNNLNGTVSGATLTTDRFGNPNCAYSFNGATSYIGINGFNCPNDWSISFWFLSNSTTAFDMEYLIGTGTGVPWGKGVGISGGGNAEITGKKIITYDGNSATGNWALGSDYVNALWYHVVVVDSASYHHVFVNDVRYPDALLNDVNLTNLSIGKRMDNFFYFNGKIDDICFYDRVLDDSEVYALYTDGLCFQTITVTDTLIINANITGFNPVTYDNTIKIYPNPTNDHITIDNGTNYTSMSGYTLKITNSLSQIVFTTAITQQIYSVDLSTWTGNGTYFVFLIDDLGNIRDVRKIILQ